MWHYTGALADLLQERLAAADAGGDSFVFARPGAGSAVGKTQVYRALKVLLAAASSRPLKFHSFRAYYACSHAAAGTNPKSLMQALGHEDPKTTFAIYARVFPDQQNEIRARADDMVAPAMGPAARDKGS